MEQVLKNFIIILNEIFTFYLVFPLILFFGIYLTIKFNFVQIFKLKLSFKCLLKKDRQCQGNISHYQAISSVLAGNFGTGNISGMAVAISTGGPGALIWMWVMAFLGASIQYTSCVLGVKYRQRNADGEFVGGPMYYLRDGLGLKKLAILFSLFTLFGAFTVGNFAQVNSVVLPLQKMGFHPLMCGVGLSIAVALVLLGGIQRVAVLASFIVPFKAVLYLGTAVYILILNSENLISAFKLMFEAALFPKSALGGMLGFSVFKAISSGFDRGLFATDAGTGIVPILQSSARTQHPVIDGVVTLVAPFLVMIVCTTTGLVLLVTGVWQESGLQSTNMVTAAFEKGLGHALGAYIVIIALVLFAFTTLLAWAYCGEKAASFIWNKNIGNKFKLLFVALIPFGTMIHVDMIWRLADLSISLMLLINLIGIIGLSQTVISETRSFFNAPLQQA